MCTFIFTYTVCDSFYQSNVSQLGVREMNALYREYKSVYYFWFSKFQFLELLTCKTAAFVTRFYSDLHWGVLHFGGGGFQQIQLRTEDRENGDLGA